MILPHIRYACHYWIHHFQQGNIEQDNINQILQFLNEHFLHWLEVLSLLGEVSEGIRIIISLEVTLIVSYTVTIIEYY